ncbi:MAG: dihydropteroate synthase [Bacteroidetes bacterium]|nr:MAG: dihydropteroate synthase [Bacteroidota bacterium]
MQLVFKHKTLSLSTPAVMGILNVTPDSFYDGGKYGDEKSILLQAEKMLSEGAAIIDIGACSTRPGAPEIPEEEELNRLISALKLVRKKFPDAVISVDTFRSRVAHQAVNESADMVNDVSGGTMDERMFETVGKLRVPYVLTHIKGNPQTMQNNPEYKDVVKEVEYFIGDKINALRKTGTNQIIVDVGFGFGKTLEHNYSLLKHFGEFKEFGLPLLAGISRKGMVCKALGIKPERSLNGTTTANTIALMNGANILRVHDVKEAKEAIKIFNFAK